MGPRAIAPPLAAFLLFTDTKQMLPQYEPVETSGSPEGVSMRALAAEPPFTAVSSLTTIHMHQDGDRKAMHVHGSSGGRGAKQSSRFATTALLQRKRKQLKTRFSDLTRSRNWKVCQKILFLLGVLGVALLASFVILRCINTDEFNVIIEWIQVL